MLRLFAGDDTYASYHAAMAYARKLAKPDSASVVVLEADDLGSLTELSQRIDNLSLFQQPEVVLLKRALSSAQVAAGIGAQLERFKDKRLVLWHDKSADKRTSLVKTLIAAGAYEQYPEKPDPWKVIDHAAAWARTRSHELGLKVSLNDLGRMVELAEGDKWRLDNEFAKLKLYADATGQAGITPEVIAALTGSDARGDIWAFLDNLAEGRKGPALAEMDKLLRSEDTQYLIAMISRELDLLSKILDSQRRGVSPSEWGMKPFVLKKAVSKARAYTWERVRKLFWGLYRLDLAVKQGRVEPETGLAVYILSW